MKPNATLALTPGVGTSVAVHEVDGQPYEVSMAADARGHILGTLDTFVAWFPWTVGVAAARTTHLDLFNAVGSGKVVRVRRIIPAPDLATAVTGLGIRFELIKTSAVGTGGTAITPRPMDSTNAALPAQITARQKPSGGATTAFLLSGFALHGEETHAGSQLMVSANVIPTDPAAQTLILREGEGCKVDQVTSSIVINVGFTVVFTIE